ncbi:hypothetical protein B5S27_g3276 [[Candida] boidinii]|nr:hypothetical protein B5S27_g3276 [[Candida] boidinii]
MSLDIIHKRTYGAEPLVKCPVTMCDLPQMTNYASFQSGCTAFPLACDNSMKLIEKDPSTGSWYGQSLFILYRYELPPSVK